MQSSTTVQNKKPQAQDNKTKTKTKNKLCGLSPRANYTNRVTAAGL
jgi:hypothetical protein